MKVCVSDDARSAELVALGTELHDIGEGVVFGPGHVDEWQQAEDELAKAFELSKAAALIDAPVVYLLDSRAVLGRASVLNSSVAAGLVAAGRCLAFEGQRRGQFVTVIGADDSTSASTIVETIQFVVAAKVGIGQTIMLSNEHLGAMLP